MQANLVRQVPPEYPPLARAARIQGVVKLNVVIGRDGKVLDAQPVSGQPMLIEWAIDAVKQWEYRPTLLNGQPIEVLSQVEVNFQLNEPPAAQ
jgi:protein TonB